MADQGIAVVVKGDVYVLITKDRVTAQNAKHTFSRNGILTITGNATSRGVNIFTFDEAASSKKGTVRMNNMNIRVVGETLHIDGRVPRNVTINGASVRFNEPALPAPPVHVNDVNFHIPDGAWIRSIKTKGSADVLVADNVFTARDSLYIKTEGSGDINLSENQFSMLDVHVTGSGDISGSVIAEHVYLDIQGTGDIRGMHGKKIMMAKILGMGEIHASADDDAKIEKKVTGKGRITIKRMHKE